MIGERLRDIRKKHKITQDELAALLGTKKSAISLYENDKSDPNDRYKVLIAKRLNISLDYLLGIIDEPMPYYRKDEMMMLPKDLGEKKRAFVSDFIEFIQQSDKFDENCENTECAENICEN